MTDPNRQQEWMALDPAPWFSGPAPEGSEAEEKARLSVPEIKSAAVRVLRHVGESDPQRARAILARLGVDVDDLVTATILVRGVAETRSPELVDLAAELSDLCRSEAKLLAETAVKDALAKEAGQLQPGEALTWPLGAVTPLASDPKAWVVRREAHGGLTWGKSWGELGLNSWLVADWIVSWRLSEGATLGEVLVSCRRGQPTGLRRVTLAP